MGKQHFSHQQRGISLLELLLSMSIGLLLLMALGALMVTSNKLAISRSTSERLDDAARQIFWRMEQDFRHAGYVDVFATPEILKRAVNLRDETVFKHYLKDKDTLSKPQSALQNSVLSFATGGHLMPLRGCGSSDLFTRPERVCGDNQTTTQQSLMVSYQVLRSESALEHSGLSNAAQEGSKGSQSGAEESCSGTSATEKEPLLTHIYGLHKGGLSCIGIRNGLNDKATTQIRSASQPIAYPVDEMMFRYLVVPETTISSASKDQQLEPKQSIHDYLTAAEVEKSALGWSGVVGVEVCLVLAAEPIDGRIDRSNSEQNILPTCQRQDPESKDPNALWAQGKPRQAGDLKMYRRYHRVIALPNHLHLLNIEL
ncbi:MAG: prepilin-type N-terminal cleavage/methylation domain-containing protein [Cardiobacteriaceae bacterium]|nr:prepilin-type N-terminal cleavage/methylation domain-containing protein [Cardiobacteriaceae bacterium]